MPMLANRFAMNRGTRGCQRYKQRLDAPPPTDLTLAERSSLAICAFTARSAASSATALAAAASAAAAAAARAPRSTAALACVTRRDSDSAHLVTRKHTQAGNLICVFWAAHLDGAQCGRFVEHCL